MDVNVMGASSRMRIAAMMAAVLAGTSAIHDGVPSFMRGPRIRDRDSRPQALVDQLMAAARFKRIRKAVKLKEDTERSIAGYLPDSIEYARRDEVVA